MLFLLFQIGGDRYALDCAQVVEIVPMVGLRELPKAPPYLRGVFQYRGRVAPVVDLCALTGFGPARELLSTRIIMVGFKDSAGRDRVLGLIAERVMETIRVDEASLVQPGIAIGESSYLGWMINCPQGLVQCIRPEALLSASLGKVLFPAEEAGLIPA